MFNCRGISKNELEEYEAEYTQLARELDKKIDEETHTPIARCAGKKIFN